MYDKRSISNDNDPVMVGEMSCFDVWFELIAAIWLLNVEFAVSSYLLSSPPIKMSTNVSSKGKLIHRSAVSFL